MAEEVKPGTPPPATDDIKNLKAEMERKIGNIEKTNQALLTQLQAIAKPKPLEPAKKDALKDVWYDDPEKATELVVDKAATKIFSALAQQNEAQTKKNTVLNGLYREYPELQDYDHPLTTKAVELFDKLSDDEKSHPMAYRLAVKEAAEELEIKPKAKRKPKEDDEESFTLSGGSKGKGGGRKDKLDSRTVDFAKLVGLNMDDEKVAERVKSKSQRQNWNRWE